MNEPTICRTGPPYTHPQPSDPGYMHQSDTLSRRPITTAVDPVLPQYQSDTHPRLHTQPRMPAVTDITDQAYTHTFPRSLPQPACTQSMLTSALPCQPAYLPTCPPTLVGPSSRDDVLTSPLSRRPIITVSEPVYTHYQSDAQSRMPTTRVIADQAYTHTPPHSQLRTFPQSLAPACTQSTMTSALPRPPAASGDFAYDTIQPPADRVDSRNVYTHSIEQLLADLPPPPPVHRQSVPLSSVHTQTTASEYVNTTPYSSAPLSQATAVGQPDLSAFSQVDTLQNRPIVVGQPGFSAFTRVDVPTAHPAPLQSPSVHWRKRFAYDYVQPDTGLGAPTHAAPAVHSGYIRPQTSDTHTHI